MLPTLHELVGCLPLIIAEDEIHIWLVNDEQIGDQSLLTSYRRLMSSEEADREKRFVFEEHRHQFLVTRALIREVLSLYRPWIRPREWQFEADEFGKPFIANHDSCGALYFNVSHTKELVAMAVVKRNGIGIDVESTVRSGKFLGVADSFFAPAEVRELFRLPACEREDRFFDLWTLKEAYIKARGVGLSMPLDEFGFAFPNPGRLTISFYGHTGDHPDHWGFWQFSPSRRHRMAVALESAEGNPRRSVVVREIIPGVELRERQLPILRSHGTSYRETNLEVLEGAV